MRIADYPNKDITKSFKNAVSWLNSNQGAIRKLAGLAPTFNKLFGKSNWGMPRTMFDNLKPTHLKWLQEQTKDWVDGKVNGALDKITVPPMVLSD